MSYPLDNMAEAMVRHAVSLPRGQVDLLDRYCQLLWRWNERLNLTRHTTYDRFVGRDVVDSRVFAEFLEPGEKVLDVGTGGGVPGVILKVLRPDLEMALCEPVGKKVRAVSDMVEQLGLDVAIFPERAQNVLRERRFDTLVARAVGTLRNLLKWLEPHWKAFDRLLVVKGPAWVKERGEARHHGLLRGMALRKLTSYPLPGGDSEGVLLEIHAERR